MARRPQKKQISPDLEGAARRKTQVRGADSRALLLKTATDLFAERGFDGVSVRDIVEAANVNISLVSYYFGGKEGLLDACLEESGVRHFQLANEILQPPATWDEFDRRLRAFVEQYLESRLSEIALIRLAAWEMENNSPVFQRRVKTIFSGTLGVIGKFFATSQERGFVRTGLDPNELAAMLNGQLNFLLRTNHVRFALNGTSLTDEAVRRKVATHLATVILHGIGSDTATPK